MGGKLRCIQELYVGTPSVVAQLEHGKLGGDCRENTQQTACGKRLLRADLAPMELMGRTF